METESSSLRNNRKTWAALAAATLVAAWVFVLPADMFDHTPSICLWHLLGFGPCPGCGMTRAVWHLLHLEFRTALHYN